MFYKIELEDHIRVPPNLFSLSTEQAIIKEVKKKYDGFISKDLGFVIDVSKVLTIGEGIIIAGDGAPYFSTKFELLSFKPELHEVVEGRMKDIADFGAFISLGATDGMIHISQTMNDFVSFSKDKVLIGKDTKRTLKIGDICRAKIIAISYKDISSPKIGLTMRQPCLGKLEWVEEDLKPRKVSEEKPKKGSEEKSKKSSEEKSKK